MIKLKPAVNIVLDLEFPFGLNVTRKDTLDEAFISGEGWQLSFRKFKYPYFFLDQSEARIDLGYRYNSQDPAWFISITPEKVEIHPEKQSALPLYYYSDGKKFYASSDFVHLVENLIPRKLKPNLPVIVDHLMLESSLHDETILEGVFTLYENSYLEITNKGVEKKWYPSRGLSRVAEIKVSPEKAVLEMKALLKTALKYHIKNINKLGLKFGNSLSGGKDSSTVSHVTYELSDGALDYYSLVQPQPQKRVQLQRLKSFAESFKGKLNLVELNDFQLLPELKNKSVFDPNLEIYRAATEASAKQGAKNKIAALFTGFGGDELFMLDMFEEDGFAGNNLIQERQVREIPFFFSKKLSSIYRKAAFAKPYPEPKVAHSVRSANFAYNPIWHSHSIWPIAPLGDLELTKFCRSLPQKLRGRNKELFNLYHKQNKFPDPFLYVTKKDSFGLFYVDAMTRWSEIYLEKAMQESPLADMRLLDPDSIVRDFKYNILPEKGGSGLSRNIFTILATDMFFRNYKKGG